MIEKSAESSVDLAPRREARMAEAVLDDEMIESMRAKIGVDLRIEHSTNNRDVTRLAIEKFATGIGDTNPLWLDETYAAASVYGAPVAPCSWIICCFSGLQFGWPGLGSFHSSSNVRILRPIMQGDVLTPRCTYEGFDGPRASTFAKQTVTDHFRNTYTNQLGETVAEIQWDVVNFERQTARRQSGTSSAPKLELPQRWTDAELLAIEDQIMAEQPRGEIPRWWDDVEVGDALDELVKGPIGMTDEIAFVSAGGAPIPRLAAHRASLLQYRKHPAWAFRDPTTSVWEPIYSVHYNAHAAQAMGVAMQYDVGFQRQSWQMHLLTDWMGDDAWLKRCSAQYRSFVYLSDVVRLCGEVTAKYLDTDGDSVVDVRTHADNQRGQNVMPGTATIVLPTPAARRLTGRRPSALLMTVTLDEFRTDARRWLAERLPPRQDAAGAIWGEGSDSVAVFHDLSVADEDALDAAARAWHRTKLADGWAALTWPERFGGRDLPSVYERAFADEESHFAAPPEHEAFTATLHLMTPTVAVFGTPEQQNHFIPPFLKTDWLCCQLFSEPDAESDLASLRCAARPCDGGWVIDGQKVWTSGARLCDYGLLIARSDPAGEKHHGMTAFLVPFAADGVDVRPIRQMTGGRASFYEVFLDGVELPDSARLGPVGDGWKVALATLGFERSVSADGAGGAGGSPAQATALARHLGQTADPLVRQGLATLHSMARIAELSGQRVRGAMHAGQDPGPLGSVGKLFWTQRLTHTSQVVAPLLGARLTADTGGWGTFAWTGHVLGAPGYRIAGGSDEIQRNIIGERALGLPREPRS